MQMLGLLFAIPNGVKTALAFIIAMLAGNIIFSQSVKGKTSNNSFYFYYGIAGMGSNLGSLQPTLKIDNNKFSYTIEQNSYWGKRSKKKEFISEGTIRQSSIDSIAALVHGLKDSTIYRVNPCILSGRICHLTVVKGTDTTKFTLHNTVDSTVLKIINILNPYLPSDKRLPGSKEEITEEEECWKYIKNSEEDEQSN